MKNYWNKYYKLNSLTYKPSDFAKFCHQYLQNNNINFVADIGSGNFRDTFFFLKKKKMLLP